MNIKELLLEIANKPLPFKYNDAKDGILGTFKSKGDMYIVWAMPHEKDLYELTFNISGGGGMGTFSAVTRGEEEKGNVFEVIATVRAIYEKWFKKYKPKKVMFHALDKHIQRYKIFGRMLKQAGYEPSGKGYFERKK